jgi:hypothetical protein
MKKYILGCLCFVSCLAQAESYSGYAPFPKVGNRAVSLVWERLEQCGLTRVSAFHPSLPPPSVPAQEAILSPRGELLAYYMEEYGGGFSASFKNPNGSYKHSVSYNNGHIRFVTPYVGVVAQGNTFATVGAVGMNLYCRSVPVDSPLFLDCIEAGWVNQIVGLLCPYGNGLD